MVPLTQIAHQWMQQHLKPGATAIDATAGNGHDTLFLARAVCPTGLVYAIDRQAAALAETKKRLAAAGIENVSLIQGDHAELTRLLPSTLQGKVGAVMFNLGYLPGGDHSMTTQPASTVAALAQALRCLKTGGVMTVLVYPGHAGGEKEANAVQAFLEQRKGDIQWEQDRGPSGKVASPCLHCLIKCEPRTRQNQAEKS